MQTAYIEMFSGFSNAFSDIYVFNFQTEVTCILNNRSRLKHHLQIFAMKINERYL